MSSEDQPTQDDQMTVNVVLRNNGDGTVNIGFEKVSIDDIDELLLSVSTAAFKDKLIAGLNASVKERSESPPEQ